MVWHLAGGAQPLDRDLEAAAHVQRLQQGIVRLVEDSDEGAVTLEEGKLVLNTTEVLTTVAQDLGWSTTTVRRRAQASIRAISRRYAALPVAS